MPSMWKNLCHRRVVSGERDCSPSMVSKPPCLSRTRAGPSAHVTGTDVAVFPSACPSATIRG